MARYSGKSAGKYGALGGEINFEWIPDPEVVASKMMEIAGYLDNVESPLVLSQQVLINDIRQRFQTKTDPDGSHWQEWSDSYRPDAEAHNIDGILVRTGELRSSSTSDTAFVVDGHSIFYDTGGLPEYWLWNQEGATRSTGTGEREAIAYAKHANVSLEHARKVIAQEGGTAGANILPARPFVGVSFEAELRIVEIFDQWFEGAIALGTTAAGKAYPRHSARGPGGRFIPRNG